MAKAFRYRWFLNSLAFICSAPLDFFSGVLWWAKVVETHPETQALFDAKTPVIYAIWHGRMFGWLKGVPRDRVAVLISPSNDGEFIARTVHNMGFKNQIRGSHKRGGTNAMRGMLEMLTEKNTSLLFTVDGPRGPRYQVKAGVIKLAAQSGAPIIPMASGAKWHLWFFKNAWDHYHAPFFFTPVKLLYGEPVRVPKDPDEDQLEAARKQLEESLMALHLKADALDGYKNGERL